MDEKLFLKKTNLMLLFMDGVELPQGCSHFEEAFFTTKFPEIPGTLFVDLGRMKGWIDLGVVLNTGHLDWEFSALTTRPLLHNYPQKHLIIISEA